ncbi:LamG domain-containing protein [Oscillatoria amoena NRMC-F 0135]|nr:LamG domain-containing protein [Oscillatoria amoena NRMC-F 0135]
MRIASFVRAAAVTTATTLAASSVSAVPVAYWSFESDLNSSIGGYTGTATNIGTGAVTLVSDGTRGNVVQFSGTSGTNYGKLLTDYAGIGGNAPRSFVAWIKTPGGGSSGAGILDYGKPDETNKKITVRLSNTSGNANKLRGEFRNSFVEAGAAGTVLNDDVWRHIALTFDGTDVKLFVNGAQEASAAIPLDTGLVAPVQFGAARQTAAPHADDTARWYAGLMDDIAFYDFAVAPSDLAALADGSKTPLQVVVPEPASLSLIALAGVLLGRRRPAAV